MRRILIGLFTALLVSAAHAQAIQQSSTVTPSHVPYWVTNGVQADGGTAADSPITTLGVTSNTSAGICVSSGRSTAAGRQQLCLGAPLSSSAIISLQNYGTATAQNLSFVINGTTITIPTGGGSNIPTITTPLVNGDYICASGITGILADCTWKQTGGSANQIPFWSSATVLSNISAAASSVLVTSSGNVPSLSQTLPAAVQANITATGTVASGVWQGTAVGAGFGGTGNTTLALHSILVGEGTSPINQVATANVGYCLLSQGAGADPIFAPCASGSGTAGGANTQIQFNSSSSLAGNVNLTWISPTLTIGVNATTTGQLALASGGGSGQSVTIQNRSAVGAYNFNLPTGAGTSGQPLLSGGGGSTDMTFGTLGVAAGGTNCSVASGTCLDNITGFSSNGFIQRTGSGTYTIVSSPIAVASGGTGLSSGTSGGILCYTGAGTLASSALLTANGVVIGGGAGVCPTSTASGNNGQVLLGQTGAAPTWNSASGDVSTITAGGAFTVAKVNGVAYGTSPSTNTVPVVTGTNQITYEVLPFAALTTITSGNVLGNSGSGNASLATLPATVQGNITTVGTIGTGTWQGNAVGLAYGGTGQVTAVAARGATAVNTTQALNIDQMTTTSANASYSIQATDRVIASTTTAMTGGHTWTLPACNTINVGQAFAIIDRGGVVGAQTLTIATSNSDTINNSATASITTQFGGLLLWCDGGNPGKWTSLATGSGGGSGTVTSVTAGSGLSGGAITVSGTIAMYFDPGSITNCTLVGTVSGNALTVALKNQAGADPSASSPCTVSFRNATAATGDYTAINVTAATSFVTGTSGSTFGSTNNTAFRLWIEAINNAGTVVLGVSNQSTATQVYPLNEGAVISSTACNACTNATSAGVFYSTAAQTSKAVRILGYMEWGNGLSTAGTWASGPTTIQLMGPGVKSPGGVIQTVTASTTSVTTTTPNSTTQTQSALSAAITPTSAANRIKVSASGVFATNASNSTGYMAQLSRGSSPTLIGNQAFAFINVAGAAASTAALSAFDSPNTTSSTTYYVYVACGLAVTAVSCYWGDSGLSGSTHASQMIVEEIQG